MCQLHRYERFAAVAELLEPAIIVNEETWYEVHKMCISGEFDFYDFYRGVLNIEVSAYIDYQNKPICRLWVATIDDDIGGWFYGEDFKQCKMVCIKVMKVFEQWTVLPTRDRINEELFPLGICLDYE